MHSCLYEGHVRHRRFACVARDFSYPLFMVYIDLSELETLFGRRGLWSTRGPAVARFRRIDHLGSPEKPLEDAVRDLVEQRLGWRPAGPIRLLTHFRYLGVGMNPISLYYCFDAEDRQVVAVVAEVNNTPWGERQCYVLDTPESARRPVFEKRTPKAMHVSPFLPMEIEYVWRFSPPGKRLAVRITCENSAGRMLDTTLSLRRRSLTSANLRGALIHYPLMTVQVIAGIYLQALVIWLRGVPFIPHPGRQERFT